MQESEDAPRGADSIVTDLASVYRSSRTWAVQKALAFYNDLGHEANELVGGSVECEVCRDRGYRLIPAKAATTEPNLAEPKGPPIPVAAAEARIVRCEGCQKFEDNIAAGLVAVGAIEQALATTPA